MNVPKERLGAVVDILPSLNAPTVSPLYKQEWCSVETVINEAEVREIIPRLMAAGAQGIIEHALNKVL
jgi:ATP phosphoribosyltransferase